MSPTIFTNLLDVRGPLWVQMTVRSGWPMVIEICCMRYALLVQSVCTCFVGINDLWFIIYEFSKKRFNRSNWIKRIGLNNERGDTCWQLGCPGDYTGLTFILVPMIHNLLLIINYKSRLIVLSKRYGCSFSSVCNYKSWRHNFLETGQDETIDQDHRAKA